MRKITALFLILVLLMPVLGKLGVWMHYQANLRYYAEVLCENQDKPDLNCDGHCVLAQRIAATTPQPPAAPSAHLFQFELSAFVELSKRTDLQVCQWALETHTWCFQERSGYQQVFLGVDAPPPEILL